jgi:hypothetical protein
MENGAHTGQSSGGIILPSVDEVAEFAELASGEALRSALGNTSLKELSSIALDTERDLTLRFEAARKLSQQLLSETETTELLAAVEQSVAWKFDVQAAMQSEGGGQVCLFSREEKLSGQIAALALQETTLRNEEVRGKALDWFLAANSQQASDENQRAVLMLQRITAEDEIADFVCHWIAEVSREEWRREALPLLIGINSEAASLAYARVIFGLPETDRESSLRRDVNRLKEKEAPRVQRKTLSGEPVPQEPGIADLLERFTNGLESVQETLLVASALLQLSVFRPENELIEATVGTLREIYGLDGLMLPQHFELSDGDRLIKAALKATLLPRCKPGEEAVALDIAFDMAVASVVQEHATTEPAVKDSRIVGSKGGAALRSELAVSVLMDSLGIL